jgi:hypothetical protein
VLSISDSSALYFVRELHVTNGVAPNGLVVCRRVKPRGTYREAFIRNMARVSCNNLEHGVTAVTAMMWREGARSEPNTPQL